jgi:hypothetical protein
MSASAPRGTLIRRLAPIALVPAAALAVHQLRYWLAFGGHAGAELQRQGHSYLHSLVPWIVLLLAIAAGLFLRAVGRAFVGHSSLPRYTASFAALWLLCAGCLVSIFVTQELLEGLFATGHPAALAGVFGYGGWLAVPAALVVGLVLAALLHGARRIIEAIAGRAHGRCAPAGRPADRQAPQSAWIPRLLPLADGWSGRGPPALSA